MMSLGQKVIAIGTILFMNLLVFLFMGPLVILSLIPSAMLAFAIVRR